MSTGIMAGTGTLGTRRPAPQDRTLPRAQSRGRDAAGTRNSAGTRRRHFVPPRTGSRQQVSVRGRRVVVTEQRGTGYLKVVVALVILVGIGVATAMFLSARTTEQAFALQQSQERSERLGNELESLNRDYKELSSSEHLASEAARLGMVVPGQTGVLDTQGDRVNEVRPADGTKNSVITDVDAVRQGVPRDNRPTSDPTHNAAVPAAESAVPDTTGGTAGQAAAPVEQQGAGAPATQTGQLPYSAPSGTPAR